MNLSQNSFRVPSASVHFMTRAVYVPSPGGGLRLSRVETSAKPIFSPDGWEEEVPEKRGKKSGEVSPDAAADNLRRAVRRAKQRGFDAIMCNPDLDLFATLTYNPDTVEDKADYSECFRYLNTYFKNRVQRRGLKYVCAPERTKAGDVHFHFLCNSAAVDLAEAHSPYTGQVLTHGGKVLYNVTDWHKGFSSAEFISGEDARDKVAKYIFKYIGKDLACKVGGRYLLMGGALAHPVYAYGDAPDEFIPDGVSPVYVKAFDHPEIGTRYEARYFI